MIPNDQLTSHAWLGSKGKQIEGSSQSIHDVADRGQSFAVASPSTDHACASQRIMDLGETPAYALGSPHWSSHGTGIENGNESNPTRDCKESL